MQQEKMGCLLRELRKEKEMTQEQMAELFGVTNRTISRWENGINMPDISILLEISNYFEVSLLELIEGERKKTIMPTEKNEELRQVANYADEQKSILLKKIHYTDVVGMICCMLSGVALEMCRLLESDMFLLLQVLFLGIAEGVFCWKVFYETKIYDIFSQFKKKHHFVMCLEILLVIIVLLSILRDCYLIFVGRF